MTALYIAGRELRPRRLAPAAVLLPAAELAVAGALLSARLAWLGALAALGLLVLFSAAIAAQLARGRRPECNCFGAVHAKPIGPATLVRNLALLGCAAAVVAAGPGRTGPGAFGLFGDPLQLALGVLALLAAGQAALVVALLRRHGRVLARLDELEAEQRSGPAVGEPAPDFLLPDLDGELVTLADLRAPGLPVARAAAGPDRRGPPSSAPRRPRACSRRTRPGACPSR